MEVTQERIIQYLNKPVFGLTKDSDEDDLYMFEFLREKGFMSSVSNNTLSITNEGKAFLRNAYYFNPVPMTVFEWRNNIIDQLKDGEAILKGDGRLFERAKDELKQDGLIERVETSYFTKLTSTGRQYVESNLTYKGWLSQRNSMNFQIGHNFNAGGAIKIDQSNLSTSALNRPLVHPTSSDTKQSIIVSIFKWIFKNIIQILIGVTIAAIAYLLGLTKSH